MFTPMLATLVDRPFSSQEWLYEKKFDGQRCLVVKEGGVVKLYSRNGLLLNKTYPELVEAFAKQKAVRFIVDGEIVAFDKDQESFAKLQTRMQRDQPLTHVKVHFYVFDLLKFNETDLRKKPLIQRKKLLKEKLSFGGLLHYVTHIKEQGEKLFQKAYKEGWEGVIAKRCDSLYHCKRSREWLKFKCEKRERFFIVGFTDPQGTRVGFGALLVGYFKGDKLYYAGKVGTGYDRALLEKLSKKLKNSERKQLIFINQKTFPEGTHFVTPRYLCEVAFTEWTSAKRLRHPKFLYLVSAYGHHTSR
ncbi:MAG: ATP-dependent DNA ligase [Chlamydiae bacterium]|nr:ATP-dependent DNA ligase [Chlamydiota bacterium]